MDRDTDSDSETKLPRRPPRRPQRVNALTTKPANGDARVGGSGAASGISTVASLAQAGSEYLRIRLEDGERLKIPVINALRMKLRAGYRLDAAQLAELRSVAQQAALRDMALRLLGRREHSRRELAHKLEARYPRTEGVESLLDALQAQGVQSDERFARSTVRHRMNRAVYGPRRVYRELIHKGVSAELAAEAVDSDEHREGWLEVAMRRLEIEIRRAPHNADAGTGGDGQSFRAALRRRGFTDSQIDTVLEMRDATRD